MTSTLRLARSALALGALACRAEPDAGDGGGESISDCEPREEIPYDAVDQDCDGADVLDADGDGHDAPEAGGDDCDDTDGGTWPGAPETPYDGVDQDCDGADLTDLDGDGFDAVEAAGTDCDDTDVDVHPGSAEVEGDGADNDCDGYADEVIACPDGSGATLTIQDAVDLAPDGGTVEICPGRWRERVLIDDRRLTVRGGGGMPEDTVLDASRGGPAITASGDGTDLTIDWLSLQGDDVDDVLVAGTGGPAVSIDHVDISDETAGTAGLIYMDYPADCYEGSLAITHSRLAGDIWIYASCLAGASVVGNTFAGTVLVAYGPMASVAEITNNIVTAGITSVGATVAFYGGAERSAVVKIAHNVFSGLDGLGVGEAQGVTRDSELGIPVLIENNIVVDTAMGSSGGTDGHLYSGGLLPQVDQIYCNDTRPEDILPELRTNLTWDSTLPSVLGLLTCSTYYFEDGDREWTDSLSFDAVYSSGFLEVNPMFEVSPTKGHYSLDPLSPAIDAGSGDSDPDGSPADIGAFGGPNGNWYLEYPWPLD